MIEVIFFYFFFFIMLLSQATKEGSVTSICLVCFRTVVVFFNVCIYICTGNIFTVFSLNNTLWTLCLLMAAAVRLCRRSDRSHLFK